MVSEIERVGHRQVVLLLLLGCYNSIVSINHTLPTFQGYTPHYFCEVDNVSVTLDGCVKELNYSIGQTEPSCPLGYQFESERDDWTIVTEWQLVCERRYLRPMIATIYFCGVTLGAIVCGLLADRYGRHPVVLICLYVQGLLGASLYFTKTLEAFMVLRFIQGFFVQGLQGSTFALLIELFPAKFRTTVAILIELYWSVGLMFLAGASYLVPQWRPLELVLCIPTAATLFYVCFVPESPRWLASHGKAEEAQKLWNRLLPQELNVTQDTDVVKRNLITDELNCPGSSKQRASQNAIQKENTFNQPISKHDSYSSLAKIVIDNCDVNDENRTDAKSDTLIRTTGKDCNEGVIRQQKYVKTLNNDELIHHCNENIKNYYTNYEDNPKKEGNVEACDMKNSNQNCSTFIKKSECDKEFTTENPSEESQMYKDRISIMKNPDGDASVDSSDCLDHSVNDKNIIDVIQNDKEPKVDNTPLDIDRNSSVGEGLNRLWKEIVQELGYDIENKPKDVCDKIKVQDERGGDSYINGASSTEDNNRVGIIMADTCGRDKDRDLLEDEPQGNSNMTENNTTANYSLHDRDLRMNTSERDMDHIDVIYSSATDKCKSLERKTLACTTYIPEKELESTQIRILDLFRNSVLRKYTLIMVFVWFSIALSYYGIMFYLPGLSGERHLNFFLGALLEVFSFSFSYVILTRFGRRLPMASYSFISGITCLAVAAVSAVSEEDVSWIGKIKTAMALLGKSSAIGGFGTMFLYASELFPTVLRGAAMGHCGFWGRVGSLIAPQLLFLGEYTLPAVPLVIMGILGLLAGLAVLALPETLGQQLPDTVEEAEMLAKNKSQIQKKEKIRDVQFFLFEDQLREIQ